MNNILITGSTSGIGEAFAEAYAKEGNRLILVARNIEKLEKQKVILSKKCEIETISCDLINKEAATIIAETLDMKKITVDTLIQNAGFNEVGNFATSNLQEEIDMIQLHNVFVVSLTKLLLPNMIRRKYGNILIVGSTGSFIPCPGDAIYGATKAFLYSFSTALHYELKAKRIHVSLLCPGATRTAFAEKAHITNTALFKFFVMNPENVAKIGVKALDKNKRVIVAGVYNKLTVAFTKLMPMSLVSFFTQKMME